MSTDIIKTLRNVPGSKIDLLYDKKEFSLQQVGMNSNCSSTITLSPTEFIELLKAGLDYYEVNENAMQKIGLRVVKR